MKNILKITGLASISVLILTTSCKKPRVEVDTVNADLSRKLKEANETIKVGCGVDYEPFVVAGNYQTTVKEQFSSVTAGYVMKHGAIVRNNGTFDFTKSDNFVNTATTNGLEVFGHTLCWHENQNAAYMNALLAQPSSNTVNPSIIQNGTFEAGSGNSFSNWSVWNGPSYVSAGSGASESYEGTRSLKAAPGVNGNPWEVQIVSDPMATTVGASYTVKFYAKAASAGGKFRLSTNGGTGADYSGDYFPTTSWTPYEWSFTANGNDKRLVFDMGYTVNSYFIDSVSVKLTNPAGAPPTFNEQKARVDNALKTFITTYVTRYKGKVKAWDVVNEALGDDGVLRNGISNGQIFYWSKYLGDMDANGNILTNGDSMVAKAFRYARAADPDAKLFYNDYGHEYSTAKLEGIINLVTRLKAKGVPIDGVGLQMHMNYLTSNANIDNVLYRMAKLGLLVRISELDISVNLGSPNDPNTTNFVLNPIMLQQQAAKYRYVAESYITNVPAAQRYGISVWGVTDGDTWLKGFLPYHTSDYPLLWNADYTKKEAFSEFLTGLQLNK